MAQLTISARQRVYYDKRLVLDEEEHQQFLALGQDPHLIYRWLLDNGHDFDTGEVVEWGDVDQIEATIH